MQHVLVRWTDAADNHDDAVSYDDARKFGAIEVWTSGFLVRLDDQTVTVAQSLHVGEGTARDLVAIPLGMVNEVRPLALSDYPGDALVVDGHRMEVGPCRK